MSQRRDLTDGQKISQMAVEIARASAADDVPKFDLGLNYTMTLIENPDGSVDITLNTQDGGRFTASYDSARGANPGTVRSGPQVG